LAARSAARLPAEITSFVGRRGDVATVRQLFSSARLVTLTGVGGVGKTRLALRAAEEMRRAFADGVHLVELASLSQPDLLVQSVIDALGIRERPKLDPAEALEDYLLDRRMLLVLDNCEHVVEATADLVARLLRAAPDLKILVTSRQALHMAGEHVYPVPPLPAPDVDERWTPGAALQFPAVALFADRAVAAVPGFAITRENEAAVVRLCQRLEGIPLAIELASVRLRVLTVDELADRLDDRFQLLRDGGRNLPARHQTLSALIDWSYDLCTPAEQALWARASVFAGGFSLDALETVCADEALPASLLLDTVAGLVDKSILVREQRGKHVRFRMLDTVREYGAARLADLGDTAALARRHRDWFAELVERATREWVSARQEDWALLLHWDHANIRLALEYCMARADEVAVGVQMAAQPWFWASTDHLNEASLWLDRGLSQLSEPSHAHAWALANRGYIAAYQGNEKALREMPERAREMAIEIGDLPALAVANHVIGFRKSFDRGDARQSIPLFIEAMRQYDEAEMAGQFHDSVVVELATTYALLHDFDDATALIDDLYDRCAAAGERWNLSYALWLRALVALLRDGAAVRAEQDLVEALRIKRVFRDTIGLGLALEVLGWTAATKGDAERAAMLLGGADQIWSTVGSRQLGGKRSRYEELARSTVGDSYFEAIRERGSRLSTEELVRYALREDGEPQSPAVGINPLTKREKEVAELVADGMSNKQIAERLVISLRTAEGHVEKILSKQGFNTRTQIASWVTRQRATRT
jgi:predicted ATPase/DNA-binding CsgD family transcriptional regulator